MRIRHVAVALLLIVLLAGCGVTSRTTGSLERASLTPTQTSAMLARVSKARTELATVTTELKAAEEQPAPPPVTTTEAAPPPPPPVEPPPAAATLAGLNAGGWGSVELTDLPSVGLKVVRLDTPSSTASYEAVGLKVIDDIHGPYNSGGVSGLNHTEYVSRVVSFVKANPHVYAIEVLNEPGGNWFWGSNSESSANRESYGKLVIEVNKALVANFGVARPLELCSWDGGHDSSNAWGKAWSQVSGALAACDGVTNHPYGGTGARSSAILGNRHLVEETHHETNKPVYITEVGFPTKGPTGDSLQYTETEQAQAVYNFGAWANHSGYVPAVTFYGYRDEGEGGGYGIEYHTGVKKKAWTALKEFSGAVACTVCS